MQRDWEFGIRSLRSHEHAKVKIINATWQHPTHLDSEASNFNEKKNLVLFEMS